MMTNISDAKRKELLQHRTNQQNTRRQLINAVAGILSIQIHKCPLVRDFSYSERTGCLSFRYNGKRVQYWIGPQTLLIRNAVNTTTRLNYSHQLFTEELLRGNNYGYNAFKLEDK